MRTTVTEWAKRKGIDLLWPDEFPGSKDFRINVCLDFGKFIERVPFFVLRPSGLDQLVAAVAFLNERSIPYKIRGAAHSSGGQVLTDDGAVIDLSGLSRILEDDPDNEEIRVEGGIWWLHLAEYLHAQKRRPVVLTDNLRTSVAGTLSVGGFGDTTHLHGLQIEHVTEITLVTPDAEVHRLNPSDRLFRYVLAGRGQLGIIAEVRMKTISRSSKLNMRLVKWHSIERFVEDAFRIRENRLYEFSRTRVRFHPEFPHRNMVVGVVGNFQDCIPAYDRAPEILKHAKWRQYEQIDLFERRARDPHEKWKHCSPAVEMIFPLPHGIKAWRELNLQILDSGLFQYLPRGSSIMVLRGNQNLPLAPLPDSDFCLMIALRPAMTLPQAQKYLPLLFDFESQALKAGAKIYLMSIEPRTPNFLDMQFGSALQEFIALKKELDPKRLLNRGFIPSTD